MSSPLGNKIKWNLKDKEALPPSWWNSVGGGPPVKESRSGRMEGVQSPGSCKQEGEKGEKASRCWLAPGPPW